MSRFQEFPSTARQDPFPSMTSGRAQSNPPKKIPPTGHADSTLSRLIMGFVERRIAPQTLADVMGTQIAEQDVTPDDLSLSTCNGVLEALTSGGSVMGFQNILLFVSQKKEFPHLLSASACLGSLSSLLVNPFLSIDPSHPDSKRTLRILDQLAKRSVELLALQKQNPDLKTLKMRLTNAMKSSHTLVGQLGPVCANLLVLRQILLKGAEPRADLVKQAKFSSVHAVISAITSTPDHVLVHHIPKDYSTVDLTHRDLAKLDYLDEVFSAIKGPETSRFQVSFLIEWLFSGCLKQAIFSADDAATFTHSLELLMRHAPQRLDVAKGVLRALQRDLSLIHTEYGQVGTLSEQVELTTQLAQHFFKALWSTQPRQWEWLSREFFPWALQLPCHPPESRLVTREQVDWLQTLCREEWSDALTRPPVWVVRHASQTAAPLFVLAPGHWLQHFAGSFVDALHREATSSGFILASAHMDFVEFLIRQLRKKSPLFASQVETLICLTILGRARANEQNQMKLSVTRLRLQESVGTQQKEQTREILNLLTQPQTVELLGPNPIARALHLLSRTCRHVEVLSKRENQRKTSELREG